MTKHTIKHIHAQVGTFNGFLYFTVNNKLMVLTVGTPMFNDYKEWRISDITISEKDYVPEGNTVEFKPFNIVDIVINDEELNYLNKFFLNTKLEEHELEKYDLEINQYIVDNPNFEIPFLCNEPFCAIKYTDGLKHIIHDYQPINNDNPFKTFHSVGYKEVLTNEWIQKENIMVKDGIYNLLIPIMEGYVKSYLSQRK